MVQVQDSVSDAEEEAPEEPLICQPQEESHMDDQTQGISEQQETSEEVDLPAHACDR